VTPSYAGDLELLEDLHASVLRWFPEDALHLVIVPIRDLSAFAHLAGPRCHILAVPQVLPRHIHAIPGVNAWVNSRAPWPPLRGWIVQQMVKFGAADHVDADALVLADSDVVFVRPVDMRSFTARGAVRFYRLPSALDRSLPRHLTWTGQAGRMLGIPIGQPPYDDHIFSPITWDRRLVLATRQRIEEATGRDWATELGRRLQVSECLLYGMFVNDITQGQHPAETSDMHSQMYWDEVPLDEDGIRQLLGRIGDSDIAVMLSSKSGTPPSLRRAALREANII
jgi:hypothetical protein